MVCESSQEKKGSLEPISEEASKAMDAGARLRRKKQREEHRRYVSDIIPDHLMDEFTPVIEEGKSAKSVSRGNTIASMTKNVNPFPEE